MVYMNPINEKITIYDSLVFGNWLLWFGNMSFGVHLVEFKTVILRVLHLAST